MALLSPNERCGKSAIAGTPKVGGRRRWHPTPVLLPGRSHGRRSLVGCGPWGREESDTTERLHFRFSLSCIGEGNGNPLQCSCLENPRDGGAWWAAVYGIAQSWTRLKRLSSSSSRGLGVQDIIFLGGGGTHFDPHNVELQWGIYGFRMLHAGVAARIPTCPLAS